MALGWRQIVGRIFIGLAAADAVFLLVGVVISSLSSRPAPPPSGLTQFGEASTALSNYLGGLLPWIFAVLLFLLGRFLNRQDQL